MSCYPLCEISICDVDVTLAHTALDGVLTIKKGSYTVCSYELTSNGTRIEITDTEILDFGDIAHVFTLQLKNAGVIIPIEYYDCDNILQTADAVRLRINDCTTVNTELNEVCF